MRIKLDKRWTDLLVTLPESGMGYQRVDVTFSDGRELKDVMVWNAELLEVPAEFAGATIADVWLHRQRGKDSTHGGD